MNNFYILVGDKKTWESAFKKNIWGFSKKTQGLWGTTKEGDHVCFYVTSPVKKIIGFGKITRKFKSSKVFWPDEILFKKVLWPYRFEFNIITVLDDWDEGIKPPPQIILNQGRKKINQETFSNLVDEAEKKWEVKLKEF